MKVRVTKSNLYHNGQRKAVGDVITLPGETIPTVFAGKVEPINETGLTTDQNAGGNMTALQAENEALKQENEALRAESDGLKAKLENGSDEGEDTSAEADAERKAWLIDEIEKLTGERPGSNSKLETLDARFEKAKLAEKD